MKENITKLCQNHSLFYSNICIKPGCRKLLCLKCLDQHKKLHGKQIKTFLDISQQISDDIECFHRNLKLLCDSTAVALKNYQEKLSGKPNAILTKLSQRLHFIKPTLDKLTEFIAEIAVESLNKQNNKITEIYLKFINLKHKLYSEINNTISLLGILHFNYQKVNLLYENNDFELAELDKNSKMIYFVDPIQKTTPFTLVNDSINICENAQLAFFNDTLLLVNGSRQELFQSSLQSIGIPHSATKFVPRSDLKFPITAEFSIIVYLNSYIYLVSLGTWNQKYSFFEDQWFCFAPLRMKNANFTTCLISQRYIYAFRGLNQNSLSAEVFDILNEEQGWILKLIKAAPLLKYPMISKTTCFQQDSEGIILVGNTTTDEAKIFYYDSALSQCKEVVNSGAKIKLTAQTVCKNQGNSVSFIEEILSTRKVWTFYKQLKQIAARFNFYHAISMPK